MSQFNNTAWNSLLPPGSIDKLDKSAFLSRCRSGLVSRIELETFLVQHFHYSRHFTRYLCALLANISNEADRLTLTENLFEEMGLGDLGNEPHAKIYRDMLQSLGLNPSAQTPFPETAALATGMLRLCSMEDPIVGLGALCLGAEAIVPHVYTQVMQGLVARGFDPAQLRFFPMHIDGDDDHALTMKAIIDRELSGNPEKRATLMQAAEEAIGLRTAFFEAISMRSLMVAERENAHAI